MTSQDASKAVVLAPAAAAATTTTAPHTTQLQVAQSAATADLSLSKREQRKLADMIQRIQDERVLEQKRDKKKKDKQREAKKEAFALMPRRISSRRTKSQQFATGASIGLFVNNLEQDRDERVLVSPRAAATTAAASTGAGAAAAALPRKLEQEHEPIKTTKRKPSKRIRAKTTALLAATAAAHVSENEHRVGKPQQPTAPEEKYDLALAVVGHDVVTETAEEHAQPGGAGGQAVASSDVVPQAAAFAVASIANAAGDPAPDSSLVYRSRHGDVICAVCFQSWTARDNPMFVCSSCAVPVHRACYGVDRVTTTTNILLRESGTSPDTTATASAAAREVVKQTRKGSRKSRSSGGTAQGDPLVRQQWRELDVASGQDQGRTNGTQQQHIWHCAPCKDIKSGNGGTGYNPRCCVCPRRGGAFHRTETGGWMHVACALWISELRFMNAETMTPIGNLSKIAPRRRTTVCNVCGQAEGCVLQCLGHHCRFSAHVLCAFLDGCRLDIRRMDLSFRDKTLIEAALIFCCKDHLAAEFDKDVYIRRMGIKRVELAKERAWSLGSHALLPYFKTVSKASLSRTSRFSTFVPSVVPQSNGRVGGKGKKRERKRTRAAVGGPAVWSPSKRVRGEDLLMLLVPPGKPASASKLFEKAVAAVAVAADSTDAVAQLAAIDTASTSFDHETINGSSDASSASSVGSSFVDETTSASSCSSKPTIVVKEPYYTKYPYTACSPGRVGLVNMGNTCFFSSVIQVLSNTAEIRKCFGSPTVLNSNLDFTSSNMVNVDASDVPMARDAELGEPSASEAGNRGRAPMLGVEEDTNMLLWRRKNHAIVDSFGKDIKLRTRSSAAVISKAIARLPGRHGAAVGGLATAHGRRGTEAASSSNAVLNRIADSFSSPHPLPGLNLCAGSHDRVSVCNEMTGLVSEMWTSPATLYARYPLRSVTRSSSRRGGNRADEQGVAVSNLEKIEPRIMPGVALCPSSMYLSFCNAVPALSLNTFRQQDAHECFRFLLDRLSWEIEERLKNVALACGANGGNGTGKKTGGDGVRSSAKQYAQDPSVSVIRDTFQGTLLSEVQCLACHNRFRKAEPFLDLSLDIPEQIVDENGNPSGIVSLDDCLKRFSASEQLLVSEQYHCSQCKTLVECSKRMRIERLPSVLCIHLKRFRWRAVNRRMRKGKVLQHVSFPLEGLDMTPHVIRDGVVSASAGRRRSRGSGTAASSPVCTTVRPDCIYDLYGIIRHHGAKMQSGHYTAYALNDGGDGHSAAVAPDAMGPRWFHFDDEKVSIVDATDVGAAEAYMLLYRRRHTRPSSI